VNAESEAARAAAAAAHWPLGGDVSATATATTVGDGQQATETLATLPLAVVLKLEKKSDGEFEPEEWMGVLAEAREENATVHYDVNKKDEFDVQEYIKSIGGYNERSV
jgi:hypothetical protein